MPVKVQVNDRSGFPRPGVTVDIKWSSGFSSGRTDGNGIYDTGVDGNGDTIEYIKVYGEYVAGNRRTRSGEFITIQTNL